MTLNTINQNKKIHMCMKIKLIYSNQPISSGFFFVFIFHPILMCFFKHEYNNFSLNLDIIEH